MIFYAVHKINHSFDLENDTYGSKNVRTLIIGGMIYILLHAYIFNPTSKLYDFRYYLYYMMLLDVATMGVVYKMYYGTSLLEFFSDTNKSSDTQEDTQEDIQETKPENKPEIKQEIKSETKP